MKHIIKKFTPSGGKHCITNALKQVFSYYGHPMSEEMIFGIASGLGFTYINLAHSPMVSGRSKPFEFEEKLASRFNITIACRQPKRYDLAFSQTIKMLNEDRPVLVYVDMPFMRYLNLNENSHFGGHAIVIVGYDDLEKVFYVSDRDGLDHAVRTPGGFISETYHQVSYDEMELARSSRFRPFPANNKYLDFNFTNFEPVSGQLVASAIKDTCEIMLNPPANLSGINGIKKFSREIKKWDSFDREKIKVAGITNYFQINEDGGTGGGIFRKMYGDFLMEADNILPHRGLAEIGSRYTALSNEWDLLAESMWSLGETGDPKQLAAMSDLISNLCQIEKELLSHLLKAIEYSA